jgi:hypothetical protein
MAVDITNAAFVAVSLFHPSLIFARKAGAHPSAVPKGSFTLAKFLRQRYLYMMSPSLLCLGQENKIELSRDLRWPRQVHSLSLSGTFWPANFTNVHGP